MLSLSIATNILSKKKIPTMTKAKKYQPASTGDASLNSP